MITVGSVVRLNSGGPLMTVLGITGVDAHCAYFDAYSHLVTIVVGTDSLKLSG